MKIIRTFQLFMSFWLLLQVTAARAETGVTESEIRIGMWTPLSGPVALLGQSARDAVRLWAKEVNDKGGINGRKINFISYDDAASPQEAQAAVRRLIDQDQVFMLISGSVSGSTLPVRQVITRDKVPFVSSISSNMNLMRPFSRASCAVDAATQGRRGICFGASRPNGAFADACDGLDAVVLARFVRH